MSDLFQNDAAKSGPVECLGQTFPSDEARREHYLKLLAEKLKDPDFRKTEGFPIGSDEDILALSDPPYHTACPNPFAGDFVAFYGTPYTSIERQIEPFTADVSEGKNDPIYTAHSYHTKVPHKAVMRYVLHYTKPGELIADVFCGTGMTGVAAKLCGDKSAVETLGYRVDNNGEIFMPETEDGKTIWRPFSRLGERRVFLNDLSPAATFIASNYNSPIPASVLEKKAKDILAEAIQKYGWMYRTLHLPTEHQKDEALRHLEKSSHINSAAGLALGQINFTLWSDVFICPQCAGEIVFWDAALDTKNRQLKDEFSCPHCSADVSKRNLDRAYTSFNDSAISRVTRQGKQVPVLINYSFGGKNFEKRPDSFDFAILRKISENPNEFPFPVAPMMFKGEKWGDTWRAGIHDGLTHVHHFYTNRNLKALAFLKAMVDRDGTRMLADLHNNMLTRANRQSSLHVSNYFNGGGGVCKGHLTGTLYVPSLSPEISALKIFEDRIDTFKRWLSRDQKKGSYLISTGPASRTGMPDSSLDYVFVDPPFGSNLMYSELNFIDEAWHKVFTNQELEAIESPSQKKRVDEYRRLMLDCFREIYRTLKPGRWMTVEFSNTQASIWNAIQTSLQESGFVVANVSALDKKQGSFKAVTTSTAVKQDLVISAYKPNGGLEERFSKSGGGEESVWDFVRTHLQYLPTVKVKAGQLEFIAERDPRIIFDRMVAWFVRHNTPVPMSTQEFQAGLMQRFVERDGMVFLSDQVAEYDKKRLQVAIAPQMELFVSDERSAIDWLSDFLKRRPSTYQEVSPEFMGQLGAGWKKHETKPELSALLEDNFLKYDGTGEVPSQIHSYLSTNHKDLRGLEKISPALVAKAKDRWYVPDPNKAQDLEKKREKALLKEFETYMAFSGRKIKESRLEVLRAGFRAAWAAKDYKTIIGIANKLPEETLQEDEKLLTLYDLALTRTEDGI